MVPRIIHTQSRTAVDSVECRPLQIASRQPQIKYIRRTVDGLNALGLPFRERTAGPVSQLHRGRESKNSVTDAGTPCGGVEAWRRTCARRYDGVAAATTFGGDFRGLSTLAPPTVESVFPENYAASGCQTVSSL